MLEPVESGYWEIHKFKSYLDLDPNHFFDEGSVPILIPSDNLPKDRFIFVFTRQDKGWINQIPSISEIEISDQYNKKQKFIFINLENDNVASIDPQYSRFVHDAIAVFITNDSGEIIEKNLITAPVSPRSGIII